MAHVLALYEQHTAERVRAHHRIRQCCAILTRELGWMPVADVVPATSRAYAARRRTQATRVKRIGDGTIGKELGVLRAALNRAVAERWISGPAPVVELPTAPPPRERWLTADEARALLDACAEHHLRVFVTLGLHTAARPGAILDLQWTGVDFGRGTIDLRRPGEAMTAKGRAVVPMTQAARAVLVAAYEVRRSPYVVEWRGQRVASVKRALGHAARAAGLRGVSPHVLRHTAATWLAMAGVPMREISLYLGHSNEATTARVYAKYHPDHLRGAADALDAMQGSQRIRSVG